MFSNRRSALLPARGSNFITALVRRFTRSISIALAGALVLGACLLLIDFAPARAESGPAPVAQANAAAPFSGADNAASVGGIFSALTRNNGRFSSAAVFATLVVTNTNDSGLGSLRQAIIDSNASPGVTDTITFNIPGSGVQTITPLTGFPILTDPVIIDGTTQPGWVSGSPVIELNGTNVGANADGLRLSGGNSVVRALIINRFRGGITLTTNGNNTIEGNLIGTNASGTAALPNVFIGVSIEGGSNTNTIGGTTVAQRNIISGNGTTSGFEGIRIFNSNGNIIRGNLIGTNKAGTAAIPNSGDGILIGFGGPTPASSNNVIGGTAAGAGNLISGNASSGIRILDAGSTGNQAQGNLIGTNGTGAAAIANAFGGVFINAPGNTIGGTATGSPNLISGNNGGGISIAGASGNVVQGNFVGTNISGTAALGNSGNGIGIDSSNNLIGGTTAAARNVISGNINLPDGTGHGIVIGGASASGNQVQGNYIGTNAAGTAAVANGRGGVFVFNGAANNSIVGNLLSGNAFDGISIQGVFGSSLAAHDNQVLGNLIGTNAAGTAGVPNASTGIRITGNNNIVGGTTGTARNVISGNASRGVYIDGSADGNVVQGNYIGTDASGTAAVKNSFAGLSIVAPASNNLIGGSTAGALNVISGNDIAGVTIESSGTPSGPATGNRVQGNYIGVAADGVTPLGNTPGAQTGWGVTIPRFAAGNLIGGTAAGEGNIIAYNAGPGISVNTGTAPVGTTVGNSILGNSIFNNGGLGIDLDAGGIAANDLNDPDGGANNLQNYPVLTSATTGLGISTNIAGSLNSVPNTTFTVQLFSSAGCDPSGNGEGMTLLGSTNVTTNGSGDAAINASVPGDVTSSFVTATATRLNGSGNPTDTSEFSPCLGQPVGGSLKADYQFNGDLNSSVPGAPPATNLTGSGGPNSFAQDAVDGYTRTTLRFPFNSGVSVSTAGVIPNNSFTIVFLFKLDAVTGFRRIIDFKNGTSDDGGYIQDGRIEDEPITNAQIEPSTYIQVAVVRDASGNVRVYRDGFLKFTLNPNDDGSLISPDNILRFFQDDLVSCCEASAGNVARIRLYDIPLTTPQIQALDRLPNANGGGDQSVLFLSNRDGNNEIYAMNADGSNQRRLTNSSLADFQARWSPDGQKIVFVRRDPAAGNTDQIWIMNADGSGQVRLTNTANNHAPTWKADGSKILFSRCDLNFVCDLFTMNPDGTNQIIVGPATPNDDQDNSDWSPDGSKILFHQVIAASNPNAAIDIAAANSDGSNVVNLTNSLFPVQHAGARFSRDSRKIAFARAADRANTGTYDIWVMNSDGTAKTQLTSNAVLDSDPVWSADNSSLLFSSRRDNAVTDIYSMTSTGAGVVRLTRNSAGDSMFDVRPAQFGGCAETPLTYGQTAAGSLSGASCFVNGSNTDLYAFTGTAGDQIALTMQSTAIFTRLELLDPQGAVVATAGDGVVQNSRIPASGYTALAATGVYKVRASSFAGGSGGYTLSLLREPAGGGGCTYQISPASTLVPAAGGGGFFSVLTQPGCPAAGGATASGGFFTFNLNGGRVNYTVPPNPGAAARQGTITVEAQTFTITQFGTAPPANDDAGNAQCLVGAGCPPPVLPVTGTNGGASAQTQAGEPAIVPGNAPAHSVWYSFTPAAGTSGLYSFTTSGSDFDTVMGVYRCPAAAPCAFGEMTLLGANDDTTNFDTTSKVNFRAQAGIRYMIAVDGKNGETGSLRLSWRQYEQLYRVYLQTYNGNPSPYIPDAIYATPDQGATRVQPDRVSLGVYEFNLPTDGLIYRVRIEGPAALDIVWTLNDFVLNAAFQARGAGDPAPGTQNFLSYAANGQQHSVSGFIRNLTNADVTPPDAKPLSVMMGSSHGPNPHELYPCATADRAVLFGGASYIQYQCVTQPDTLHDIVPGEAQKRFNVEVKSYETVFTGNDSGSFDTAFFAASSAPTFTITGHAPGGAGTVIDLSYVPAAGSPSVGLRVVTDATGAFRFANLTPRTYTLRAQRTGSVFNQPAPVQLAADTAVEITVQNACQYTAAGLGVVPGGGGEAEFAVIASAPACEWAASVPATVPWLHIRSGTSVGNGTVFFAADPNGTQQPREGSIRVGEQSFTVQQAAGAATVAVTVRTDRAGLAVDVDGTSFPSPHTFDWAPGSQHAVATAQVQPGTPGTRYVFASWSDGGAISHTVTAPPNGTATYTATFTAQHFLTVIAANRGTASPANGWFNEGQQVNIQATPTGRFHFGGWNGGGAGSYTGSNNPATVTINGPVTEAAAFGPSLFDFDADGRADIVVRRPADNIWYLLRTSAAYTAMSFGLAGDLPAPADLDGDGATDIAVFRPAEQRWYIFGTRLGFYNVNWGTVGDIPVPADYDGDGTDDVAVYRPSDGTWYIIGSRVGFITTHFGTPEDRPQPGDYDGDGRADLVVRRPSNNIWYLLRTSQAFTAVAWGEPGDLSAPADFDGDGKTDLAVFRPSTGTWFIFGTRRGIYTQRWGQQGDIPVAADYDGDGESDIAVYRPADGNWYAIGSRLGIIITNFGQNGDVPAPSVFNY